MVQLHDVYLLHPTLANEWREDAEPVRAEVIEIHPHVALVDFGKIRECFPIFELEQAPRGKRK